MSTRPGPRKSSLAGQTPTTPAAPAAAAPVQTPAPAVAPAAEKPKPKNLPKVSFYQDPEDTSRARAAWFHTQIEEGARSWSEFLRDAVMAEAQRLETKYNAGQAWPAMRAKEAPLGRPSGR